LSEQQHEGHPCWAVLDPFDEKATPWIRALGTDAVELDSVTLFDCDNKSIPYFPIKVRALGAAQLVALCRMAASKSKGELTEAGAFFEAVQGHGIFIASSMVIVSSSPEKGRDCLALMRRKEAGLG
jgi:hypothetical protein